MTKDLEVLLALKALVASALPAADLVGFDQDAAKPTRIGVGGCVIGDPGEAGVPDVDLSPLAYNYSHGINLEVAAAEGEGGQALDSMLLALGDAITADPFLGGLCQYLSVESADLMDRSTEGVASLNWANVTVIAEYSTTNPLG